jgi:hypothetical protein
MPAASRTSDRAPSPTAVCATCRAAIAPHEVRYRCSVSACNAGRFKLRFCSVACFEKHIPTARHRGASCVEEAQGGGLDGPPDGPDPVQAAGTSSPAAIASVGATVPPSRR